jgi:hypothetical protein
MTVLLRCHPEQFDSSKFQVENKYLLYKFWLFFIMSVTEIILKTKLRTIYHQNCFRCPFHAPTSHYLDHDTSIT